jgi:hypothetical protein
MVSAFVDVVASSENHQESIRINADRGTQRSNVNHADIRKHQNKQSVVVAFSTGQAEQCCTSVKLPMLSATNPKWSPAVSVPRIEPLIEIRATLEITRGLA